MGQTALSWVNQVQLLIRDASGLDAAAADVELIGVRPAISQFSIDRPPVVAVDIVAASRYLPYPSEPQGWQEGFSEIRRIEAPAGQTPPQVLAVHQWEMTRDPVTPAIERILIPADVAGVSCRIVFTSVWPSPSTSAAADLIPAVGFTAVSSLAASMVLTSLATLAARDRQGSMPSDFVDGSDRARDLLDAAAQMRVLYNTFIGLASGPAGQAAVSSIRQLRSGRITSNAREMAATRFP